MCTPEFCEIPIDESSAVREDNVVGIAHGFMPPDDFTDFINDNAFGESNGDDAPLSVSLFYILLGAFLGGLALNLSPCVLPLIPIQLAVLGMGRAAASKKVGALRGLIYGSAIALTYGIVGAVIVASGAVFGSIQSQAWFNILVGLIFVVLSFSLFGLFPIDFSRLNKRTGNAASLGGLFIMGVTTALLAGACVAPAVIAVVVYAMELYASGNWLALFLPLLLGVGMAFPWPIVGAGVSILPKPGRWMRYVKWAFGLGILIMAFHYFALAFPKDKNVVNDEQGVYDYTVFDEAYDKAKVSGKPIVIDFFASWCGSCDEMEKKTFSDEGVKALLAKCEFLRIRVEDLSDDKAIDLLARFNVRGFPAIVVIRP